jgi:very-short-patch-repair endonuclease
MNKSNLNNIEKTVFDILKKLGVKIKIQHVIDKYSVDFLVNDKYIIECYGDYWHCNPNKYKPSYFNKGKKKTAKEIWERDSERKKTFAELGYQFIYLWESDIKNHPKKIKTRLKKYLSED